MSEQEKQNTEAAHTKDEQKWYEGRHKEVVIYYLIAVFFLEIIIGAAAFFYGVAHAEAITEGGPRMANFPWVGWLISACLAPVGLLLLFHLSGWFFSRSMNVTVQGQYGSSSAQIPKNVEQFYSVVSNAPVIVVLLGLLGLGAGLYFLDTALGTLRPYIPWILGSATVFLVVCYVARLYFLAKHKQMERDFEYRMEVFKQTGIIIADKNTIQLAPGDLPTYQNALPESKSEEKSDSPEDIEDAEIIENQEESTKKKET